MKVSRKIIDADFSSKHQFIICLFVLLLVSFVLEYKIALNPSFNCGLFFQMKI